MSAEWDALADAGGAAIITDSCAHDCMIANAIANLIGDLLLETIFMAIQKVGNSALSAAINDSNLACNVIKSGHGTLTYGE